MKFNFFTKKEDDINKFDQSLNNYENLIKF